MLLAIPLALRSLSSTSPPASMNEQAPPGSAGTHLRVQMAIGDFLSLAPLLIVGVVADLVGCARHALASPSAASSTFYLTTSRRFGPGARTGPAMGRESEAPAAG
jgi:hypothetical protein